MTNRLSFWIVVSAVLAVAAAGFLVGPQPAALIGLIHVPMLLASLLLARAVVLYIRRRDAGIQVGGRTVLGGPWAVAVPLLFLVAWSALREAGLVDSQLALKRHSQNLTTMTQPWTDGASPRVISEQGLVVAAPEGVFGDALRAQLRHHWVTSEGAARGEVTVTGEVPSSWWPLRKRADVDFVVHVDLQMHGLSGTVRSSAIDLHWRAECEALGITSNRNFQGWIGGELGQEVHDAIGDAVKKIAGGK